MANLSLWAPLPAMCGSILTLLFSGWFLMVLSIPRRRKGRDDDSWSLKTVPSWPCLPPPFSFVWAVPHNHMEGGTCMTSKLRNLAASAFISWNPQLQNPTMREWKDHATQKDLVQEPRLKINCQPHEEPSWMSSTAQVFRWLQPQLPFESWNMRGPSKNTQLSPSTHKTVPYYTARHGRKTNAEEKRKAWN